MPNPQRLLSTLKRAAIEFRAMPGRRGKFLELEDGEEVLIAGDLHGNVANFSLLLKAADLANNPERHLIVQEIIHGPFRYGGGSDKSHQLVDLLAALTCQYPRRVHFLLGNHELSQSTGRKIGKGEETCNDLFHAGIVHAYGEAAEKIYAAYLDIFAAAALAIRTPNHVFLSHSLPRPSHLEKFELAALEKEELAPDDIATGGAAHALVWGRNTSEQHVISFLEKVDADLLITGHVPCDEGFDTPNSRQLVLDTGGEPACYCLFPLRKPVCLESLVQGVGILPT